MDDLTTPAKRCTKCGETKPLDQFRTCKRVRDGRTAQCKACMNRAGQAWREATPGYARAYYVENREVIDAANKARVRARKAAPQSFDPNTPKTCSMCQATKPIAEFYPKVSGQFGVTGRCRACINATSTTYQQANPEKAIARRRAHYERNKDRYAEASKVRYWADPEADKERSRRYRAEHYDELQEKAKMRREKPEQRAYMRAYLRQYAKAHREEARERMRQWVKNNPERHRLMANNVRRRRQARKAGAERCDLTATEWVEMMEYFGQRCAYCGQPSENLTQDHMTPISLRGDHTAANVVPSCGRCNSRKGAKTLVEFLLYLRE